VAHFISPGQVFGAGTDLHDHPLVTRGAAILQDKASCFPAHVLAPQRGAHVIDACAAPGNKTSHTAAMLRGTGRVYAFEVDPRRCRLLQNRMEQAAAANVATRCQNFLEVDVADPAYAAVEYLLLDPSCSGSGMWDTQGLGEADEKDDPEALKQPCTHAQNPPTL